MKKRLLSLALVLSVSISMAACGNKSGGGEVVEVDVPSIDKLNGDDYKDLKADIKILTNRTDIVDTVYKGTAVYEFLRRMDHGCMERLCRDRV